jgi:hypothetical protein
MRTSRCGLARRLDEAIHKSSLGVTCDAPAGRSSILLYVHSHAAAGDDSPQTQSPAMRPGFFHGPMTLPDYFEVALAM